MELLPIAEHHHRLADLLNALEVEWTRTEGDREGVHPALERNPADQKVVTYTVGDGPLEGTWSARGADADLVIFDRMIDQLDTDWRYHLACYSRVAAAMRKVGK